MPPVAGRDKQTSHNYNYECPAPMTVTELIKALSRIDGTFVVRVLSETDGEFSLYAVVNRVEVQGFQVLIQSDTDVSVIYSSRYGAVQSTE